MANFNLLNLFLNDILSSQLKALNYILSQFA
ncbi:hypothetical protein SGGBAA2069_c05930 [Streptococcus gallolyticus subsp. gallolyticus ATCC BAA-2069]|nr:hypothetical protein SGGBAA2069_c05930 [Streptococcus gallolyticus subsp. gallolyticus ATCC BAA-2069]